MGQTSASALRAELDQLLDDLLARGHDPAPGCSRVVKRAMIDFRLQLLLRDLGLGRRRGRR